MIRPLVTGPRLGQVARAIALGAFGISCGQAILTAPIGSTVAINVNPPFIAAHGDTAIVSVLVLEPAGTPVPDGTVVQFFTTLGTIQEQAKTNDGVARVNLISDARSGTARITVFSGPATANTEVIIGATRPTQIIPFLLDPRIDLGAGKSIAAFKVTVLDTNGNPVVGVPVRFSVIDNPAVDTILEGEGTTNNSGEVFGRVQTKRTTSGTIRILAVALTGTPVSREFTISVVQ